MSALERSLSLLEKAADWANPILVKETRQALKSRQFVVTFMLMLAISWLLFVIGVAFGGSALEYGAPGAYFFSWFWVILAIAVTIIVPFGAQRSLLAERDQATYDLLSITTLTPKQIVWGKLLSALVQVLIFYSAIAPFIAFTSLLQGFDFVFVASKLVLTLLLSLFVTMAAIAGSTAFRHRQWQAFASIGGLVGIVWLSSAMLMSLHGFLLNFDPTSPDEWAGLTFALAVGASYFVLFQKIATAQLTFASDDRSSGIRIVCSAQFFLVWIGLFAYAWYVGSSTIDGELVVAATILTAIHLTVVGLFASTEESFLSRRIRRNLPVSAVRRLLHVPFLQGAARGYLYTLLHVVLFAAVSAWASAASASSGDWSVERSFALGAYLVVYLGMASLLGRWLSGISPDVRPGHTRVLMTILFVVGCIAPYIPLLWGSSFQFNYSPLLITNPFATLAHLSGSGYYSGFITSTLGLASIVVFLLNLPAMRRGIAEVVFADVKLRESGVDG